MAHSKRTHLREGGLNIGWAVFQTFFEWQGLFCAGTHFPRKLSKSERNFNPSELFLVTFYPAVGTSLPSNCGHGMLFLLWG